jgi:uncharacterized protein
MRWGVRRVSPIADLGLGIGWRPELAGYILARRDLGFVEVIADTIRPSEPVPASLRLLRERGVTVIPHGVGLSLGSARRPDRSRLRRLSCVAKLFDAPMVSEHVAFVRAGGREAGHLLPPPRTHAMLDVLTENVAIAQQALPVPLALENPASLFEWPGAELTEPEFLAELVRRTGCLLLLDLANLHVNASNHGFDPDEYLNMLPLDRLAYVHAAGGREHDGLLHDTHSDPLWPAVDRLVASLARRTSIPGLLLERDDRFPRPEHLDRELDRLKSALSGVLRT